MSLQRRLFSDRYEFETGLFIETNVGSIETLLHQNTEFVKQLNSLKLNRP